MKGQSGKMHIDIMDLVPKHQFTLTPEYDDTIADEPRKPAAITASAAKKTRNLISQMRDTSGSDKRLSGRLPLDRVRSDELDTFVDVVKGTLLTELPGHLFVIVPNEDVRTRIPSRDITVYAWPRAVAASRVAS